MGMPAPSLKPFNGFKLISVLEVLHYTFPGEFTFAPHQSEKKAVPRDFQIELGLQLYQFRQVSVALNTRTFS
jgi:hypothetical protein